MIKSGLLKEYLVASKSAQFMTGDKCRWDATSKKLLFNIKPYLVGAAVSTVFGVPVIIHVLELANSNTLHHYDPIRREKVAVGLLMCSGITVTYSFIMSFLKHHKNQQWFFNQLLELETTSGQHQNGMNAYEKRRTVAAKISSRLLTLGMHPVAISFGLIAILVPSLQTDICLKIPASLIMTIVKWLLSWCTFGIPCTFVDRMIVFGINYGFWITIGKFGMGGVIELLIESTCLTLALSCYKRQTELIRYRIRTQETTSKEIENANLLYRQIQILTNTFNQIRSVLMLTVLASYGTAQITTAFQVVGNHETKRDEEWAFVTYVISMCFLVITLLATVGINFLFGCCGEVHYTSTKILNEMKHRRTTHEPRVYKKMVSSYPPVKINFGSTNYIEKLTPAVFQEFLVKRLIDAILVK